MYDILTHLDLCVDFLIDLGNVNPEFGQKEKLINNYCLGLYYSHSIDWMDGGDTSNALYKKEHPKGTEMETSENEAEKYAANLWDPSPVTYDDYITKKANPQMREILTKFPNLVEIWYDYPIYMNFQQILIFTS